MDVFSNNPVTSFALTIIVQDEFLCTSNWPLCIADGVIGSLGKTGRSGLEPSMSITLLSSSYSYNMINTIMYILYSYTDVRVSCGYMAMALYGWGMHAMAIYIDMRACNECHLSADLLGGGLGCTCQSAMTPMVMRFAYQLPLSDRADITTSQNH